MIQRLGPKAYGVFGPMGIQVVKTLRAARAAERVLEKQRKKREEQKRAERRMEQAARRTAEACGRCGKPIPADAPVWLVRHTASCQGCAPAGTDRFVQHPCLNCGRQVFHEIPYAVRVRGGWLYRGRCDDYYPYHSFCSSRCQWTFYNGRRVVPEADRTRRCPVCGKEFVAARKDARTCSGVCRQRAHRARKAGRVTGPDAGCASNIASRNTRVLAMAEEALA